MTDLLTALQSAERGSRELDGMIAMQLLGWDAWRSKHGYWNISGPDGERLTVEGRNADFDPMTGEKLPEETVPTVWVDDAGLPEWTESIDAVLTLVEMVLGEKEALAILADVLPGPELDDIITLADLPRLICIALVRAKEARDG